MKMINVQKVSFFSMSNLIFVSLSCLSCECRKNLFGNDVTSFTDKKDIVPANGCTKLFVGINLAENRIALPWIFSGEKWIRTPPKKY